MPLLRAARGLGVLVLVAALATPLRADLESDPDVLYQTMQAAFRAGDAKHWTAFADWRTYCSAIFEAGRAYSLRRPDDPHAIEIAKVAVDVAQRTRYDPLSNRDASEWYVREAAAKVIAANDYPPRVAAASALLARLDAADKSATDLARVADLDANANVLEFPSDADALLAQVDETWAAWELTKDPAYRAKALERAAAAYFPLAQLADPAASGIFNAARGASDGGEGYSAQESAWGRAIVARRATLRDPRVIASVTSPEHGMLMTIRAPADEYFGRQKMSVIGIRNETNRINRYLDVGWGARMASAGVDLAGAIEDWQHQYPRDTALPGALLEAYRTLLRIDAPSAQGAAVSLRRTLLIDYVESGPAQLLLTS